jgi:predicted P-loop ATPase
MSAPDALGDDDAEVIPFSRAKSTAEPKPKRVLKDWEHELLAKLQLSKKENAKTGEVTTTIIPSTANATTVFQHHPAWSGVVALNTFHLRIESRRVPPWHKLDAPSDPKPGAWTDGDTARAVNWFARTWIADLQPMNVGAKTVEAAALVASEANTFHPVKDYWRSLTWDGEPRIDCLAANYLGGELTAYARAVGACFMVGAVARVMEPGCKLDTCVILEGKQGEKKSTFLETLASPWFADSKLPIGEKDAMQMLPGVLIWEIGELAALSKADVEDVKAFLSSRKDRFRPSYKQHTVDVPRQTVFAGTTNVGEYLHDVTGGRRFHPLRTGKIDIEALRRDRDQLWAEAVHRYHTTGRWWLDEALAQPEQAARFVEDEWLAKIATHLSGLTTTTVGEILEQLVFREHDGAGGIKNTMGKWGQREQNRVARCLTHLGWVRRQVRTEIGREWRYVAPVLSDVTSTRGEVVT